jgi:hypothetical protein
VIIAVLAAAGALTPLIADAIGGRCWIFLPAHVLPLGGSADRLVGTLFVLSRPGTPLSAGGAAAAGTSGAASRWR